MIFTILQSMVFKIMAKFSRVPKLPKKQRQELMLALCHTISEMKKPEESAKLLTDLLSPQETEMIAKRLEIAKLLIEGKTYEAIRGKLKTGYATIARVNTWLSLSGEGFKLAFARRYKPSSHPSIEEKYDPFSWYNFKRRYSLYFGLELFLEELIHKSDKRQQVKIFTILQSMENKSKILNRVSAKINNQFHKFK